MENFLIVLEPSATGYAAFSPDVPGCVATGPTVEQTLAKMRAALLFKFAGMLEGGEPLPESRGLEYYVRGGLVVEAGDLLTSIPAEDLLLEMPTAAP